MVNEKRVTDLFLKLAAFDSESFSEKQIGQFVTSKLKDLGLEVYTDNTTDNEFLKAHPDSFPNIYAVLKGNNTADPILFSAHLDTVQPGKGKKPLITADGLITSEGDTVLGADDISGIVAIIEALTVIKENNADHPDIEILFTVSEEPFCEGSRFFNFGLIKSGIAYVLDLTGKIGTTAISAPSIISFTADITGKASHAGFAPQEGISAIKIAAEAVNRIKTGKVDRMTTVNIGRIEGGTSNNIVPENVRLTGEIRSLNHSKALAKALEIEKIIRQYADKSGAQLDFTKVEHIKAYRIDKRASVITGFKKACKKTGIKPEFITTFGGSDANRLNEAGIVTVVNSCGMEKVHSSEEYTTVNELVKSAELTFNLMTI